MYEIVAQDIWCDECAFDCGYSECDECGNSVCGDIKCATSYGEKCAKQHWNKNIPNKNLVKNLYEIYKANPNLKLKHIKAHTNAQDIHSLGNKEADNLAYNAVKEYKKL